jgi:pyridoxine 4-dehydrogenase
MTAPPHQGDPRMGTLAGRPVARIGFGAMQLVDRGRPGAAGRDGAVGVLRAAIELGVNHIDTAEFYGAGATNELIRSALHPYPDDLVLVSKVGAEHDPQHGLVPAQRPAQLRAAVEANLTSLHVEQLAVVYLRRMDAPPGIVATGDQLVDLDSQLSELVALRQEGKIGAIGLSGVDGAQLTRALPVGLAGVQNAYGLLDRSAEAVLRVCAEHGLAWVPFFPLGSAFPGRPKVTEHPDVIAAAAALGVTAAQLGLAWLLAHDPSVLLIPGTSSPVHLEQNVAAGRIHLDHDTRSALDRIAPAGPGY